MKFYLEFEKPIVELEQKISELRAFSKEESVDIQNEILRLERKVEKLVNEIFSSLSPWQRVQLSRHMNRPYSLDYFQSIFEDFIELHGDRNYADDPAIVGGFASFDNKPVLLIGHQKGRSTKEKVHRNFGMPRPEGYRKALRLMCTADRHKIPIITFIDTPGAYPGVGAEERGQSEKIKKNIMIMSLFEVPIISVVIGEGGSGGALAIGVANRVLMLENAVYSVISPESCAAILWRDSGKAEAAAKSLKMTAPEIRELGIADEVIPEPLGGAHRNFKATSEEVAKAIKKHLNQLSQMNTADLTKQRYDKYRTMGVFSEEA